MYLPAGDMQFAITRLDGLIHGHVSETERWQQLMLIFNFSLEP
jgi:hypothetical protein